MSNQLNVDTATLARTVAFLVDRVGSKDIVLGSAFLIDSDKAATCAHLVHPYVEKPQALKLFFPASQEIRGVKRVISHPQFDRRSKSGAVPKSELAHGSRVRPNDAALLVLDKGLRQLSDTEKRALVSQLTAPIPNLSQGLSGTLAEIDLFLIVQTITAARKSGRIVLTDSRHNPIAGIVCQGSVVTHAFFGNLYNETAFYQIVEKRCNGNFYFEANSGPDSEDDREITRPTEMLLLEAHRRLEETDEMMQSLGGGEMIYGKSTKALDLGLLPDEVEDVSKDLWNVLDGTIPVSELWLYVDFDDYYVCNALLELLKTRQIEEITLNSGPMETGEHPLLAPNLVLGVDTPLAASDQLLSLTVEPTYGLARTRKGKLLGNLNRDDPSHMLHDMRLSPQAEGSPILKAAEVVGIHCGAMPYGREVQSKEGNLQQMIWIEAIVDCLRQLGSDERDAPASGKNTIATLVNFQLPNTAGCHDLANINCPKCGAANLCSAEECSSCEQRFFKPSFQRRRSNWAVGTYIAAVVLLIGCIFLPHSISRATNYANSSFHTVARPDWVQVLIQTPLIGQHGLQVYALKPGDGVNDTTPLHFHITAGSDCFLYLIDKSKLDADSLVVYPSEQEQDAQIKAGQSVEIPQRSNQAIKTSDQDTVLLIACKSKLNFMTNGEHADDIFRRADIFLGIDLFAPPVEIPLSELTGQTDPSNVNETVYIRRLIKDGHKSQ